MSEKRKYYITTPIYYPSAKLHIGHTYCTTIADSLARFHRLRGDDVFFLTGSDEHGQKIQRAAEAKGVKPIEYVDEIVALFQQLWKNSTSPMMTSSARQKNAMKKSSRL